jgi:hypothetical protein
MARILLFIIGGTTRMAGGADSSLRLSRIRLVIRCKHMTIRCIRTEAEPGWTDIYPRLVNIKRQELDCVEIGTEYLVYSMLFVDGMVGYEICCDHYGYRPEWHMAGYFEVTDPRLSKYWEFAYLQDSSLRYTQAILSFPEEVRDESFSNRLIDNEPEAVETWLRYKRLIEEEFGWDAP